MKVCGKCSSEWADNFTFCPKCGAELSPEKPVTELQVKVPVKDDAYAQALAKVNDIPFNKREKKGWILVAKAFPIVAKIIKENFPNDDIRYMVYPWELRPGYDHEALPIHFLIYEGGRPKVAVVISTQWGYRTPNVEKTYDFCGKNGIVYLRMYADTTWGDWLFGVDEDGNPVSEDKKRYCRNSLIRRINEGLGRKATPAPKPVESQVKVGPATKPEPYEAASGLFEELENALTMNYELPKGHSDVLQTAFYASDKAGGYIITSIL